MPLMLARKNQTLAAFCMALFVQQASGACEVQDDGFVWQDIAMDLGQVVVLPNTPVGGVIKEVIEPVNRNTYRVLCDDSGGARLYRFINGAQQVAVPGFDLVYATDVEGIGVRVSRRIDSAATYYPYTYPVSSDEAGKLSGKFLSSGQFVVQLIKTSENPGSGRIAPNGRFTSYHYDGSPNIPMLTSSFVGAGATVISPSCEVEAGSRNIAVDFGDVANIDFNGVGSYVGGRDFEIRLTCQGGTIDPYKVNIRIDAEQDASNMPGVLKLNNVADSATGVGIQIVQRDGSAEKEIHFNEGINLGSAQTDSSDLVLPLRARYVQTESGRVGAGVANGYATFTIEYP